jgi:hypothetical protein
MNHKALRILLGVLGCFAAISASAVPTFFGPSAYTSSSNIPAGLYNGGPTFLEDFEDSNLGGGITASVGSVIPPGFEGFIDSVDADDGSIDGSGSAGHSWFSSDGATGVRFTFPVGTTAAGLVWTDGAGTISFSAFGPGNVLLGTFGPFSHADGNHSGGTAEDRFYGISDLGGIESILISNTSGGIEVDHVQYGPAFGAGVPDAGSTLPLLGLALAAMAFVARRRASA